MALMDTVKKEYVRKINNEYAAFRLALLQTSRENIFLMAKEIVRKSEIRKFLISRDSDIEELIRHDNIIDSVHMLCREAGINMEQAVEILVEEAR